MKVLLKMVPAGALLLIVVAATFAPFVAPYSPEYQFRQFAHQPPMGLGFWTKEAGFQFRPFVYVSDQGGKNMPTSPGSSRKQVRFLVKGVPYSLLGLRFRTHLFGLDDPDSQVFLLGTDALGRDIFSRILLGTRLSLQIGLSGIVLTLLLGVSFGAWAGYRGGWLDRIVMRLCDLFLSLPGLFLVLGIRAVFPLQMTPRGTFWVIVLIFALVGWGTVTRVVRGQVLSLRERPYVLAARTAGASDMRILLKHILPFTSNFLMVQSTVLIPGFILGEITLSFLGVGIQEPEASLGALLNGAVSVQVFQNYSWELSPVVAIFTIVFCFNLVGEQLKSGQNLGRLWL